MIPDTAFAAFESIATEIEEAVDAEGYTVEVAMAVNPSFTSAHARAMLLRDIVTDAAARAASRAGIIDFQTVNGTGKELRYSDGGTDYRFRIRRAHRVGDLLAVRANSDSALANLEEPEDFLIMPTEQWVLGWHTDDEGVVADAFIARVLPGEGDSNCLNLGPQYALLSGGSFGPGGQPLAQSPDGPDDGFTPTEQGLPGFDTTDEQGGEEGGEGNNYGAQS